MEKTNTERKGNSESHISQIGNDMLLFTECLDKSSTDCSKKTWTDN